MKIIFIQSNDEKIDLVMKIRNTVFEKEQGAIESEEIDCYDNDLSTLYALAFDGENAVATGRLAHTQNGFKIGRIAVLKSQRGKGTGAFLVNALCEKCVELGADRIFVDSQLHAIKFYEKLGFVPTGDDEIIDRGIKHLPMVKL